MNKFLLQELTSSKLMLDRRGAKEIEFLLKQDYIAPSPDAYHISDFTLSNGVAIIPIAGVMTKYAPVEYTGIDAIAALLMEADSSADVKATILLMDTPGGSTNALFVIEEILKRKTKPVITVVDGAALSCGYYVACLTDAIICRHEMAEVGSIGVFAELEDDSKMLSEFGIQCYEVYPPESKWKNKSIRDLREGNPDTLIREELSPWAKHFQETVKANRPQLNTDIEGILEGRVFFAKDAKENGLIDEIADLQDVVEALANDLY